MKHTIRIKGKYIKYATWFEPVPYTHRLPDENISPDINFWPDGITVVEVGHTKAFFRKSEFGFKIRPLKKVDCII